MGALRNSLPPSPPNGVQLDQLVDGPFNSNNNSTSSISATNSHSVHHHADLGLGVMGLGMEMLVGTPPLVSHTTKFESSPSLHHSRLLE